MYKDIDDFIDKLYKNKYESNVQHILSLNRYENIILKMKYNLSQDKLKNKERELINLEEQNYRLNKKYKKAKRNEKYYNNYCKLIINKIDILKYDILKSGIFKSNIIEPHDIIDNYDII
jgi:hypothetical protein